MVTLSEYLRFKSLMTPLSQHAITSVSVVLLKKPQDQSSVVVSTTPLSLNSAVSMALLSHHFFYLTDTDKDSDTDMGTDTEIETDSDMDNIDTC
jgi:hypothetical protein